MFVVIYWSAGFPTRLAKAGESILLLRVVSLLHLSAFLINRDNYVSDY